MLTEPSFRAGRHERVDIAYKPQARRAAREVVSFRPEWSYLRQPGNNPESHKLSGQVLINALTVQVGTGTDLIA